MGSWKAFPQWTSLALIGVVLGAVYTLTAYLKTMFGGMRASTPALGRDIRGCDAMILTALAAIVVALGVFPGRLLDTISSAVPMQAAGSEVADNNLGQGFVR
jgi:NADH:ubiquinone oxidoreductase subunit 4 (subunit M)